MRNKKEGIYLVELDDTSKYVDMPYLKLQMDTEQQLKKYLSKLYFKQVKRDYVASVKFAEKCLKSEQADKFIDYITDELRNNKLR